MSINQWLSATEGKALIFVGEQAAAGQRASDDQPMPGFWPIDDFPKFAVANASFGFIGSPPRASAGSIARGIVSAIMRSACLLRYPRPTNCKSA